MLLLLCVSALLPSCYYDVPLTAEPTRAANPRFAGTWTLTEPEPEDKEFVISLTGDRNYSIRYEGDVHRAFHSDVDGMPILSVEVRHDSEAKWFFAAWNLSKDGTKLTLHILNPELISGPVDDRAALVGLVRKHRDHPDLIGPAAVFTKK